MNAGVPGEFVERRDGSSKSGEETGGAGFPVRTGTAVPDGDLVDLKVRHRLDLLFDELWKLLGDHQIGSLLCAAGRGDDGAEAIRTGLELGERAGRLCLHHRAQAIGLALLLSACQDDLYTGLTQKTANEMIAILSENGIKASRAAGDTAATYKIRVSSDDLPQAVRVLKASGHPKDNFRSIGEVFPGDGIIVTPFEQRVRMSFAISQELSRTISDIDGVVSARVHLMLAEADTRNSGRALPPSASVVVHQSGMLDVSELSQRIRLIVSNAVTNLPQKSVSVSIFQARSQPERSVLPVVSRQAGPFEVKSPLGLTLWILAALALLGGFLLFNQRRKQPK